MDIFSFSLLFSIKTRSSASTGVPVRTDGQTPVARYSAAGRAQTRCFPPIPSTYPRHCLTRGGPPKAGGDGSRNPLLPRTARLEVPPRRMRAGQEWGAEDSGGPFPPQNAPSRVWLTSPQSSTSPLTHGWLSPCGARRGWGRRAGAVPCRAGLCGMRCGGQRPQLAQCRAPLASGGERGGDVPACLRRPGGPARPRTARPGARQSGAAPPRAHPARQRSPDRGWGLRLRPPRLRGARFCSSPRPACCSGVLRFGCPTQPNSPDVRSFVLFALSSPE